jgi:hypothetical protein
MWLPIVLLGGTATFNDIPLHVRCLIATPLLVGIECYIAQHLAIAAHVLKKRQLLPAEAEAKLNRTRSLIQALRDSTLSECLLLALALTLVLGKLYLAPAAGLHGWRHEQSPALLLAVKWDAWIAHPIYYFLALRWVWRFLLWSTFLFRLSILKLDLQSQHPDQSSGLSFLVYRHLKFAFVASALATVSSAKIGEAALRAGHGLKMYYFPIALYLVIVNALLFAPLLVFTPQLIRSKRRGLERYGGFGHQYAKQFNEKWLVTGRPQGAEILGTPDLQSLNDMDGSYDYQRQMGMTLIHHKHVLTATVIAGLPYAPLIFIEVPLREVLLVILKSII